MSHNPIIIERLFTAEIEDVWRAITEKELMKQWYFDLDEFRAEVGFTFEFIGGPEDGIQYVHQCEITEVIPQKKLTYRWKYKGYAGASFVTFELVASGTNTKLILTHSGIETFPDSNPDFAIHNFETGWNHIINTSLDQFLSHQKQFTMNSHLQFDFTVNKENNTIVVKRDFDANLEMVWKAWTDPEILDLWWAPKPFQTKTKFMDFRVGGYWLYAMVSPEGAEHWCRADYQKVDVLKSFSGLDAFCDAEGNINDAFPNSLWNNTFSEHDQTTTIDIIIEYKELADLEKIIQLGFKEGFTMALANLDEYLESQLK